MSVSFFVSVLPWASVKSILRDPGCIVDFLQKKLKSEQMFPLITFCGPMFQWFCKCSIIKVKFGDIKVKVKVKLISKWQWNWYIEVRVKLISKWKWKWRWYLSESEIDTSKWEWKWNWYQSESEIDFQVNVKVKLISKCEWKWNWYLSESEIRKFSPLAFKQACTYAMCGEVGLQY